MSNLVDKLSLEYIKKFKTISFLTNRIDIVLFLPFIYQFLHVFCWIEPWFTEPFYNDNFMHCITQKFSVSVAYEEHIIMYNLVVFCLKWLILLSMIMLLSV